MDVDEVKDAGDELADLIPEEMLDDDINDPSKREKTAEDKLLESDIARIMYGCGDDKKPYLESVELIRIIIQNFVTEFCQKSLDLANQNNRNLKVEDMMFLIRQDKAKFRKVTNLLNFNQELKQLRKNDFKTIEEASNKKSFN